MTTESIENCKILKIFVSSRDLTLAKINQSHRNAIWNWNSFLRSNKASFKCISCKDGKEKSGKLKNSLNSCKFRGHNSCKNESITLKCELEL
jgi:hypothetical protein